MVTGEKVVHQDFRNAIAVKRLLTRYDYPSDKGSRVMDVVLEQAELVAIDEAA